MYVGVETPPATWDVLLIYGDTEERDAARVSELIRVTSLTLAADA
jgi:hypothetical protein